ncbi:hypothetical protein VCC_000220 [Vibrio cholerae RC9]|nr:hypothetical protein VCC_000220 [Vibrio cholerae RC9]
MMARLPNTWPLAAAGPTPEPDPHYHPPEKNLITSDG